MSTIAFTNASSVRLLNVHPENRSARGQLQLAGRTVPFVDGTHRTRCSHTCSHVGVLSDGAEECSYSSLRFASRRGRVKKAGRGSARSWLGVENGRSELSGPARAPPTAPPFPLRCRCTGRSFLAPFVSSCTNGACRFVVSFCACKRDRRMKRLALSFGRRRAVATSSPGLWSSKKKGKGEK